MSRRRVRVLGRVLELSNLEKVLYPETGFTKAHVLDYYRKVAPWLLPHLRARALTLKRYPDGVEGEIFYEKRCPDHRPDWMTTAEIRHHSGKSLRYCAVNDLASLMWVANLASLELHTLLSREARPDWPTMVIFDLDPGPPAGLVEAGRVCLLLRRVLGSLGLETLVKLSGKKGLHCVVPLNTPVDFDQTKAFARTVAERIAAHDPERVVSKMSKAQRGGRVFIDWSQNDGSKTTVCAYSLRAGPQPTVSAPLEWEELETAVGSGDAARLRFDAMQMPARLAEKGDLFAPLLTLRQRLPGARPASIGPLARWDSERSRAEGSVPEPDPSVPEPSAPEADSLDTYRSKREQGAGPEPTGGELPDNALRGTFVIQKHQARRLHYDFRLECEGVLKSWAVPKGPSLDPSEKRLAVHVEDHPMAYALFEGSIPAGQYGAGQVIVWDRGPFELDRSRSRPGPDAKARSRGRSELEAQAEDRGRSEPDTRAEDQSHAVAEAIEKGELKLMLHGVKLQGKFLLVRTRPADDEKPQWLLIKKKDDAASEHGNVDPLRLEPWSVLSGLWIEDLVEAVG